MAERDHGTRGDGSPRWSSRRWTWILLGTPLLQAGLTVLGHLLSHASGDRNVHLLTLVWVVAANVSAALFASATVWILPAPRRLRATCIAASWIVLVAAVARLGLSVHALPPPAG